METIARLAVRRPVAMLTLAAGVVLLGVIAWKRLPQDLLPDVQSPTILVSVSSGARPPAEMERQYGEQVEQRLFAVRGVRQINQVARTGRLVATVVFEWGADLDLALVEAQKAISPLSGDPDIDEVIVRRFDPRQAPVLTLGLVAAKGRTDLAELRRIARRQVAPALERLSGVAEVRVLGGREREIEVQVDRSALDAHGLTLSDLESRLRAANVDINAGALEERDRVLLVRGIQRFRRIEDIAAVVLRYEQDADRRRTPLRLGDVARVAETDARVTHLVRVDGAEGVGLSVYKEAGANTVAVSRTVRAALERVEADLPGVKVVVAADEAALVEDALGELTGAALLGVLLSVLVLVIFLRAAAPTLIVAAVVPISVLGAIVAMYFAGQTLNIMTLGGLALGAGMLVDNAIVIVESIFRRLSGGARPEDAAWQGTAEVATAIVSSTLANCVVFLPVLFIRGLAARLVGGLAFSVVASQIVSLIVAVLLIPALARWFLPRSPVRPFDPGAQVIHDWVRRLLKAPLAVTGATLLLALFAGSLLYRLGAELLPPADPRQISVRLVGPAGQPVAATARTVAAVEDLIRSTAGVQVQAVLSEVGAIPQDDRLIQEEEAQENTARVIVRLAAGGKTGAALVAALAPVVGRIPDLSASWEVGVSALARALGTSGPPLQIEISGQSLDELRRGAEMVRARLAEQPEVWNVRSSFEGGPPELHVTLDRVVADGLGADLSSVSATLEAALDGREATTLSTGDEEREIVLRLPAVRQAELAALPVTTSSGARVALGEIARFTPAEGAREIFRRDQRRVARVTARISPDADYPRAMAAARRTLSSVELPPGLLGRVSGEEEERERTFQELGWAVALALLLIFMVLAGSFESLVHPLTVMAAVPQALIGVAFFLAPFGDPVGVMALVGLIVLAGVAVNDAILLVDAARRFIAEGVERDEALARAAAVRLRPMLMMTLTAMLGVVPLAIGGSESARLRAPMALTIIGGLLASLIGALLATPCLYKLLDSLAGGRRRRAQGRESA